MIDWFKQQRKNPQNGTLAWYPTICINSALTADDVIVGIVEKCTLTKVDVKAVLIALEEVIIEQLKLGNSVRFGNLGSFRPTLKTRAWDEDKQKWGSGGCEVPDTIYQADGKTIDTVGVTSDNIAGIGVAFSKSSDMIAKLDLSQLKFRQRTDIENKKYPVKDNG